MVNLWKDLIKNAWSINIWTCDLIILSNDTDNEMSHIVTWHRCVVYWHMHTVSLFVVIYLVHISSNISHDHYDNEKYMLMECNWKSRLHYEYEMRWFWSWHPPDYNDNFYKFCWVKRTFFASRDIFNNYALKKKNYRKNVKIYDKNIIPIDIRKKNEIFFSISRGVPSGYVVYYH